jgi:hypothetical protein
VEDVTALSSVSMSSSSSSSDLISSSDKVLKIHIYINGLLSDGIYYADKTDKKHGSQFLRKCTVPLPVTYDVILQCVKDAYIDIEERTFNEENFVIARILPEQFEPKSIHKKYPKMNKCEPLAHNFLRARRGGDLDIVLIPKETIDVFSSSLVGGSHVQTLKEIKVLTMAITEMQDEVNKKSGLIRLYCLTLTIELKG